MFDDTQFKYELQARYAADPENPAFWRELTQPALEHLRSWSAKEYQAAHERQVTAALVMALLVAAPALWYLVGPGVGESLLGLSVWSTLVLFAGLAAMGRAGKDFKAMTQLRILLLPLKDSPSRWQYLRQFTQLSGVREHRDAVAAMGRELTEGDFVCILALGKEEVERRDGVQDAVGAVA